MHTGSYNQGMPKVQTRRLANGTTRFYVRFRLADGTQSSLPFTTKTEAETFARDVENHGGQWAYDEHMAEAESVDEPTLDEWAQRYLRKLTVSPGEIRNKRRDWEQRWKPHLGHLRLSRITDEHIIAALKQQTGAPKTIKNAWGSLASILKSAVQAGLLEKSPHVGVKLPQHEHHEETEHRYLDPAEIRQVIEDTPSRYRPLVWMLAGTGMRWGEATALLVGDVDLGGPKRKASVRVTKAWKDARDEGEDGERWYVGTPKTKRSRRTIILPGEVVAAIRPLVEGRKRTDLLFTNRDGEWIKRSTFYSRHWITSCTKNIAAPRPRIHDLRHSHVAILVAGGVSLPVIQARLGHEKITTTIDTYGHLLPDLLAQAADAADLALGTPPPAIESPGDQSE